MRARSTSGVAASMTAISYPRPGGDLGSSCAQSPLVVLTHEEYRRGKYGSKVRGFVKQAGIGSPVTEVRYYNCFAPDEVRSVCSAHGECERATNHSVCPQHAVYQRSKMQAATLTSAVALSAAHQLLHHSPRFEPFSKAMPMAAVGAGDKIVRSQDVTCSGCDRLHARVGVGCAADLPRAIERRETVIKLPYQVHCPVDLDELTRTYSSGQGNVLWWH
jgi:hypothetical protein